MHYQTQNNSPCNFTALNFFNLNPSSIKTRSNTLFQTCTLLNIETIEAVKDFLGPKRFGVVTYVCVIVHFLCGLVFTAVTAALRSSESGNFHVLLALLPRTRNESISRFYSLSLATKECAIKHKHSKLTTLELYYSKGIGQDGVDSLH